MLNPANQHEASLQNIELALPTILAYFLVGYYVTKCVTPFLQGCLHELSSFRLHHSLQIVAWPVLQPHCVAKLVGIGTQIQETQAALWTRTG